MKQWKKISSYPDYLANEAGQITWKHLPEKEWKIARG